MRVTIIVLCFLIGGSASAQIPAIGVNVGYLQNSHDANKRVFCCAECGTFTAGSGSGYKLGIFGELPVYALPGLIDRFDVQLGFGFAERGGAFGEVLSGGLPILDPNTNSYTTLERRNTASAALGYLTVDLGFSITPVKNYPFYLTPALSYAVPLSGSASYEQTEEILAPKNVLYPETNTRTKDVSSGEIKEVKSLAGFQAAAGYRFPLSSEVTASPEISYFMPFGSVTEGYSWKLHSLGAGISLRWQVQVEEPAPIPEPIVIPPVVTKAPDPAPPSLTVTQLSEEKITIDETIVTETFPILPYIFFDSASADLAARYQMLSQSERSRFAENDLPHRSLGAYHQILNILGHRLLNEPDAEITLVGTTDGREVSGQASRALARERSTRIRNYLVDAWGIDSARVKVATSGAPTFPSSLEYAEGYEENRRVEITSSSDRILRPVVHERFRERQLAPRALSIGLSVQADAPIESWTFKLRKNGEVVSSRHGSGPPPSVLDLKLDSAFMLSAAPQLTENDNLEAVLEARDSRGTRGETVTSIPASKTLNPFELSRLSLIVFDFDKSDITVQNRRMISKFVSQSILPVSKASITGSTDNLGELKHNQELSEERAFAVRNLVLKERPNANIVSTKGIGSTRQLYSNDTPEGRYYCRTVTVEVETPLDQIRP